jgi:hypothetical protein
MFDVPFTHSADFRMFSVDPMDNFSLHDCLFSKYVSGNQPLFLPFYSSWDFWWRFFSGVFPRAGPASGASNGSLPDFKFLMPPIGSFNHQHIVGVDALHDDIVQGSALFNEAVVNDDKPRGRFRCPHQGLQVNSRVTPETFIGFTRRRRLVGRRSLRRAGSGVFGGGGHRYGGWGSGLPHGLYLF